MKRLGIGRFLGMAALLGVFAASAGCADESTATEGADEAEGVAQAPVLQRDGVEKGATPESKAKRADRKARRADREGHAGDFSDGERGPRGHHGKMGKKGHGGPEKLLHAALKELDLSDAQQTAIEGAKSELRDARKGRPEPDGKAFAAVADQVRAGKVDAASIEAALEQGRPDHAAGREATARALSTLHTTLTPQQRRELVDAITARMADHEEKKAERKGDEEGKARGFEGKGFRGGKGGPLKHLLRGVDLTEDQQAKVDAILEGMKPNEAERSAFQAKHQAMEKDRRARLELFAKDRFDANAFLPADGMKDAMKPDHGARMAQALAAIVPLLDATQREALADRLAEGPMRGHGPLSPRSGGGRGMKGGR